ncbi:MAG: MerR family transcriptional regulator [Pseudomonadota bacterium]|nr:MerR family transcriptional regulator [Pseudomonadota bacterium]
MAPPLPSRNAEKSADAFRTIGELSTELGVAQHILRYWESKFAQLRPLQRAGNRRYYRPADVALARRIHGLLNKQGYTVRGVQQLLAKPNDDAAPSAVATTTGPIASAAVAPAQPGGIGVDRLVELRDRLAAALAD